MIYNMAYILPFEKQITCFHNLRIDLQREFREFDTLKQSSLSLEYI